MAARLQHHKAALEARMADIDRLCGHVPPAAGTRSARLLLDLFAVTLGGYSIFDEFAGDFGEVVPRLASRAAWRLTRARL